MRPRYRRADNPPPMRFQERDTAILQAIYDYDGVLARRHIKAMFWPQRSTQAMEARLSKLYHNGYIGWPNVEQRRTKPIPEPLVWLGWQGALLVAARNKIQVEPPNKENENQMRLLQSRLRNNGMRWIREANWNQPLHDLTVIDFRLAMEKSVEVIPNLTLEKWIMESIFRAGPDQIKFNFKGNNGKQKQRKKGVVPDSFFVIADQKRKHSGHPHRARFLLEIDMASHDNLSFGVEKAAAGAAYIRSQAYKERFGVNAGRWLVVTTGEIRMQNLINQTKHRIEKFADLFFFTTLDHIQNGNLITDPIWMQVDKEQPEPLPF